MVIDYAQPELPAVLHNLYFSINPGEKIGILGRFVTGLLRHNLSTDCAWAEPDAENLR